MDFLHSYRLVRSKMVADAFEVATPRSRKTGETWGTRHPAIIRRDLAAPVSVRRGPSILDRRWRRD